MPHATARAGWNLDKSELAVGHRENPLALFLKQNVGYSSIGEAKAKGALPRSHWSANQSSELQVLQPKLRKTLSVAKTSAQTVSPE